MRPATRVTDICTGHGSCAPRPAITGSPNVFINYLPAHRVGDLWMVHCSHIGILVTGSPNVFTNHRPQGRIMDLIDCGSRVATGSQNVFVN